MKGKHAENAETLPLYETVRVLNAIRAVRRADVARVIWIISQPQRRDIMAAAKKKPAKKKAAKKPAAKKKSTARRKTAKKR